MTLRKNIKEPITTTLGIIIILAAGVYVFYPMIMSGKGVTINSDKWVPLIMVAVGVLLIRSPDKIPGVILSLFKKSQS